MKFTDAFVFETLRLHPSVPIDYKMAVNADTLPDGKGGQRGFEGCVLLVLFDLLLWWWCFGFAS